MSFDINRRAHPRVRTLLEGRAVFNDRYSLVECIVRDLSEGGARIEFATPFTPPPEFELEVPKKNLRVWARRAWSRGSQHGLAFFEPSASDHKGPLSAVKAARLQHILDEARREVAEAIGVPIERVNLSLEVQEDNAAGALPSRSPDTVA